MNSECDPVLNKTCQRSLQRSAGGAMAIKEGLAAAGASKRSLKRKRCEDGEDGSCKRGLRKQPHATSKLCEGLRSLPHFLYIIAGESVPGMRTTLQKSGAINDCNDWGDRPKSFNEHRISVVEPGSEETGIARTRYNKAFCVEWIDNRHLAVSTKCGHVLKVDRLTRTYSEVEVAGSRWVEPPIVSDEDLNRYRVHRGGIHSVNANSTKNMLACSGCRDDDNNIYVLDLNSDKWSTLRRGHGHTDWVFTLSWVSENCFVTGGRDRSVMLWNPMAAETYNMLPHAEYKFHDTKVRCSSFDGWTNRLVTMDVSGRGLLWDPAVSSDMRVLREFQLPHMYREECTCVLLRENMMVVGARDTVTLYDPRRPAPILSMPVAKLNYCGAFDVHPVTSVAARSLAMHGSFLSIGLSTQGAIECLDKRKMTSREILPLMSARCTPFEKNAVAALEACAAPVSSLEIPAAVQLSSQSLFGREAPRYNLRQRAKIKAPDRFVPARNKSTASGPSSFSVPSRDELGNLKYSSLSLDLTRFISPYAVLRQPECEIHMDAMAHSGWGVDNAVFSHAWAPDGCAIFSCGGPLAMGVRGCYMAVWS